MTHPSGQSQCWSCATVLDPRAHTCPSCNAQVAPQSGYRADYGDSSPGKAPPATEARPPYAQGRGYDPRVHDPSASAYPPPGHQGDQGYEYGPYDPGGYPPRPIVVYAPKSAGLAVLLSFLWLGAGNLYAGQTAGGAVLVIVHFFLWVVDILLFWTIIVPILIFVIWLILAPIAMITSASAVNDYNTRIANQSY